MSGRPEPQTVAEVRQSIIREAEIEDRTRQIQAERLTLERELVKLTEELGALRQRRWKAMQSMDVTSSGNAGYEQRVTVFLMELLKPVTR